MPYINYARLNDSHTLHNFYGSDKGPMGKNVSHLLTNKNNNVQSTLVKKIVETPGLKRISIVDCCCCLQPTEQVQLFGLILKGLHCIILNEYSFVWKCYKRTFSEMSESQSCTLPFHFRRLGAVWETRPHQARPLSTLLSRRLP